MDALDLHTLRIVRAIADGGSVTAASRALGFSQPALSQHLARAEQRLGMPLVERAGRGIRLTEAGALLARHAVSVTTAMDAAAEELSALAGLRAGHVRLAAFPTASATIVPRMIARMAASHPGVRVTYVEAEPPEAVALVREGAADVAITFSYPGDARDPHAASVSGLHAAAVLSEPLVIAAPAGRAIPSRLEELADEHWIAGCPRCRGHLLAVCESAGYSPTISFETDNTTAVLSLVAAGLGVAMLPTLALSGASIPTGARVATLAAAGRRVVHTVTAKDAARVPSIAAALGAIHALDGAEWGAAAA